MGPSLSSRGFNCTGNVTEDLACTQSTRLIKMMLCSRSEAQPQVLQLLWYDYEAACTWRDRSRVHDRYRGSKASRIWLGSCSKMRPAESSAVARVTVCTGQTRQASSVYQHEV